METKHVYKAICTVQGELAKIGISKNHKNTQGSGYMFRGIDDVYNALAPLLSQNNLCILPKVIKRELVERTAKSGNALFYINVDMEFDFVSAVDGSIHTARMSGEAMDSGDKGTNKAISAAYKYVCFQTFCIPTEGDMDADSETYEVKAKVEHAPTQATDGIKQSTTEGIKQATGLITSHVGGDPWHKFIVDGKELSAKKQELIDAMISAMNNGLEVEVDYSEVVKGKYANRYISNVMPIRQVGE